LKAYGVT